MIQLKPAVCEMQERFERLEEVLRPQFALGRAAKNLA